MTRRRAAVGAGERARCSPPLRASPARTATWRMPRRSATSRVAGAATQRCASSTNIEGGRETLRPARVHLRRHVPDAGTGTQVRHAARAAAAAVPAGTNTARAPPNRAIASAWTLVSATASSSTAAGSAASARRNASTTGRAASRQLSVSSGWGAGERRHPGRTAPWDLGAGHLSMGDKARQRLDVEIGDEVHALSAHATHPARIAAR